MAKRKVLVKSNQRYNRKYMFSDMAVGDKFHVPYTRSIHQSVLHAARRFSKKNNGYLFSVVHGKDTIKVIRVK